MKDISQVTAVVFDSSGLFPSIAQKMAEKCERVLYHHPFEEGASHLDKGIIGDGLENVEWCGDFWKAKQRNEFDLIIFPDVEHQGEQLELEAQGYPVWGSREGDSLELLREKFHQVLERVGLDVPEYTVCHGMTKLREFLQANDGPHYIKISKWRGSFETARFRGWPLDEQMFDAWAVKFGPAKEMLRFMVFDPIETPLEIGGDTWNIDGHWPQLVLNGDEVKAQAYLAAITPYDDLPQQVLDVMQAFGPELGKYRYRNFWSMEIRVKGDRAFFGDATTRCPRPAIGSNQEAWTNLPEIIWAGANGEIVQPIPADMFSGEVILELKGEKGAWKVSDVPKELARWLKLSDVCMINGRACFPLTDDRTPTVGWMVGIGSSPAAVVDTLKKQVEALPDGLGADMAPMAKLLEIITKAKDKGIPFTDKPIPEPAAALPTE